MRVFHVFFLVFLISAINQNSSALQFQVLFDSEHSIALEGQIAEGVIYTDIPYEGAVERQIREQLKYTVGQLNEFSAVANLNRLEISNIRFLKIRPDLYEAQYSARLLVAWPRKGIRPQQFILILPESVNVLQNSKFFNLYQKNCLSSGAHDVSPGIFWYYYRPHKRGCELNVRENPEATIKVKMEFKLSEENTSGKSPEYHKVWEDDQLIVTAIFGLAEADNTSTYDQGLMAFQQMYYELLDEFGTPFYNSLKSGEKIDLNTPEINLRFHHRYGEVNAYIFLVKSIRIPYRGFSARYNEVTLNSDFVAYAGHSGLGANIRALARMGEFQKDQYQIFLINGCDTFAYTDDALAIAHQKKNPEFGPYKYLDLITNAMPAYFHSNSRSVMAVVKGLSEKKKTYREILSGFDSYQKATVMGEEDNMWPDDF